MEKYISLIKNDFLQMIKYKENWENEFGSCGNNYTLKNAFHSEKDFKIDFKSYQNITLFKIVPSYFSVPNAHYYYKYYDGKIENDTVYWFT